MRHVANRGNVGAQPYRIGYTARHSLLPKERNLAVAKAALSTLVILLFLTGCVASPEPREIELNLPRADTCDCTPETAQDYTFLEKGFSALSRGEYDDALEYFQRYRRLERSRSADWEADVAIAFTQSLNEGPTYDPDEARKAFRDLRKADWQSMELHQQTLLMRQSLETSLQLERENRELESANKGLQKDLEKREEALKRLRELTLGQTGSTP